MPLKPFLYFIFIFVLLGISPNSVNAQVKNQKVNVNSLSQQDVQSLIAQAQKAGFGIDKISDFARLKGLSESEISILMTKVSQQSTGTQQSIPPTDILNTRTDVTIAPIQAPTQSNSSVSSIFGSSIFNNPNLTFSPDLNLPTPQGYILGPGDQVNIQLWGKTELSLSLSITPEGYITIAGLGPIYINGLRIEKAINMINSQLDRIYDGLIPNTNESPTVFSLITLGQIRSIQVTVVGEVAAPGNYNLNSLSTLYTALYAAGGPSTTGTYRDIQLVRNNELLTSLDIYDFLINGTRNEDVVLKHNDVILVKPYSARVTVRGRMKRIGLFEINENESLANVLEFAGGYAQNADRTKLLITRYDKQGTRLITVKSDEIDNFKLQDGDNIKVTPFNNKFLNRVVIEGAVINTGQYELTEKMTIKGLIAQAGGVRGDAYEEKIFLYRIGENFDQEVLSFDLAELLIGKVDDTPLQPDDIVEVKSVFSISEEPYVRITGEVSNPGIYPYFSNITPNELILLAGGVRASTSSVIEISRRKKLENNSYKSEIIQIDLLDNGGNSNLNLLPFDMVYVRQNSAYRLNSEVRVSGEVNTPGLFAISNGQERISELIVRAKGLTEYAYPKGAILIRKSELSANTVGFVIDQSAINDLKRKILENSGLRPTVKDSLTQRIDLISKESYSGLNSSLITESRRTSLTQTAQTNDSSQTLQLPDYEPVAIDLEEILNNPGGDSDLVLRAGDLISIPSELETVRVSGEVVSSVILPYIDSKRFKNYINESGGYIRTALKGRSYVQYPNGERAGVKRFLFFKSYPKILPGSTIVVAKKQDRTPVNLTSVVSALGSVLTLALLVDRLNN